MICPNCGTFRGVSKVLRKLLEAGPVDIQCTECGEEFQITHENAFKRGAAGAANIPKSMMCRCCKKNPAAVEEGMTVCWECHVKEAQYKEFDKRRKAVAKEYAEREETTGHKRNHLDEVNARARAMGMSYGKYVALKYAGVIKDDG